MGASLLALAKSIYYAQIHLEQLVIKFITLQSKMLLSHAVIFFYKLRVLYSFREEYIMIGFNTPANSW